MSLRRLLLASVPLVLAAGLAVPAASAAPAATTPATTGDASTGSGRFPFTAHVAKVDRAQRERMVGLSWKPGCPVPIKDLRVVTMTYWGFDDRPHLGRLMVHRDVAWDVVSVFRGMYRDRFPIRSMELIEDFDADDDASMAADNTSAFNCRPITGTTDRFSIHSYGKAIDVNTVENPYVKGDLVLPPAGEAYLDRTDVRPGMVVAGDAVVTAFAAKGFTWGGDYTSLKDYQHFEIAEPE